MTHRSHTIYSVKSEIGPMGDSWRITKFVDGDVESSYLTTPTECECPAGVRPSCRHRQMLPQMLAAGIVNTHFFWDFDLGRAVDFNGTLKSNFDAMNELAVEDELAEVIDQEEEEALTSVKVGASEGYLFTEEDCIGHIASEYDPKVCANCGVHIDSLRPEGDFPLVGASEVDLTPTPTIDTIPSCGQENGWNKEQFAEAWRKEAQYAQAFVEAHSKPTTTPTPTPNPAWRRL